MVWWVFLHGTRGTIVGCCGWLWSCGLRLERSGAVGSWRGSNDGLMRLSAAFTSVPCFMVGLLARTLSFHFSLSPSRVVSLSLLFFFHLHAITPALFFTTTTLESFFPSLSSSSSSFFLLFLYFTSSLLFMLLR